MKYTEVEILNKLELQGHLLSNNQTWSYFSMFKFQSEFTYLLSVNRSRHVI